MADSTTQKLDSYQTPLFHEALHRPVHRTRVQTFYADQLDTVGAALAPHGVAGKWEHINVIPLANADEIHKVIVVPHDMDVNFPFFLRWGLIPNNATSALTIATLVDLIDVGASQAGSGSAGEPATALDETIAAITAAQTTANIPFYSMWGKKNPVVVGGDIGRLDIVHVKLTASGQSSADRLRVFCLQFAYKPMAA